MTGLALYGEECSNIGSNTSDETNKKKACYFGNFDIKSELKSLDFQLLVYFKEMSMIHILKSFLGFRKDIDLFEKVNKHITDIILHPGVEFSYKRKQQRKDETDAYPDGLTIKAEAEFLGLTGSLIINLAPAASSMIGVFHFVY